MIRKSKYEGYSHGNTILSTLPTKDFNPKEKYISTVVSVDDTDLLIYCVHLPSKQKKTEERKRILGEIINQIGTKKQ